MEHMSNEKMGRFIAELRKEKHMTQKELAARLNITDKAVSKWERGLSCPDIGLLGPIADVFGITTGELLNGEKSGEAMAVSEVEVSIGNALQYGDRTAENRVKFWQNVCALLFTGALLMGAVVCIICDLAITRGISWSMYPIISIVFGWAVLFPLIKFGVKGVWGSLAALTLLLIPFIYVISRLVGNHSDLIMAIGWRVSVILLAYVWGLAFIFKVWNNRKLLAGAACLLLTAPVDILVNWSVSRVIGGPVVDPWDLLTLFLTVALGFVLIILHFTRRKNSPFCAEEER